jgi:hypothetical protein
VADMSCPIVIALEQLLKQFGPAGVGGRLQAAIEDLNRAHAYYMAVDARITTPALLRKQVG